MGSRQDICKNRHFNVSGCHTLNEFLHWEGFNQPHGLRCHEIISSLRYWPPDKMRLIYHLQLVNQYIDGLVHSSYRSLTLRHRYYHLESFYKIKKICATCTLCWILMGNLLQYFSFRGAEASLVTGLICTLFWYATLPLETLVIQLWIEKFEFKPVEYDSAKASNKKGYLRLR